MTESKIVQVGDLSLTLSIHRERRRYSRVSLTQDGISLRIPYRSDLAEDPINWALNWISKQYRRNPTVFERYRERTYESGMVYHTPYGSITLNVQETTDPRLRATIKNSSLELVGPVGEVSWQDVSKLIAKVIVKQLRGLFILDLNAINQKHFNFGFNQVRLKYNTSNWGSCSTKANLNFNSRLFLAPRHVVEYVIIHELAHLREMNHSNKFWDLVASADPNFKAHRKWLKQHGPALIY